ncbi:hypothetical protein N9A50_02850 [Acidimicrobiaceae bacterium]|nr:hypothetical protein [Acidimicrobiaceae bacterium]
MKISYKPINSDYQVLIKNDYDSWESSHYSPDGFFKYEFPMSEFLLPTEGRTLHAMENRLVLTIECKMKKNRFYNFQITEHMKDKNLGISLKDIYENVRTASVMVFDYNLTKILPVPMWDKNNISNYIDKSSNEELSMHIKSVLLATEYIEYSNYFMAEPYAIWLIAQPSFFRRNTVIGKTTPNSQEVLNLSSAQEIDKAINNIDRDLFTRSTSGTNGGKLTDKGQQILYDFLSAYDYEMYE